MFSFRSLWPKAATTTPLPGADLQLTLNIAFREAVLGVSRTLDIRCKRACAECAGRGHRLEKIACEACRGAGVQTGVAALKVAVPAGIESGTVLRLRGEGEAGEHGGSRGDLYIAIAITADPVFTRDGDDVVCTLTLTPDQAARGCVVQVPTLKEPARLQIPTHPAAGEIFRMRGLGVPGRGDQLVVVHLSQPEPSVHRPDEEL